MIKLNSTKMSAQKRKKEKKKGKLIVTSKYEDKDNIFAYFLLGSFYYNKSTTS